MIFAMTYFLLVVSEVAYNAFGSTGASPKHGTPAPVRFLAGVLLWIAAPMTIDGLSVGQWWFLPFPMFTGYLFLYDWLFNMVTPNPYWYIGTGSALDRWQRSNGGSFAWFWIKGLITIISLVVLINIK